MNKFVVTVISISWTHVTIDEHILNADTKASAKNQVNKKLTGRNWILCASQLYKVAQ